jgi:hypothetical protein
MKYSLLILYREIAPVGCRNQNKPDSVFYERKVGFMDGKTVINTYSHRLALKGS